MSAVFRKQKKVKPRELIGSSWKEFFDRVFTRPHDVCTTKIYRTDIRQNRLIDATVKVVARLIQAQNISHVVAVAYGLPRECRALDFSDVRAAINETLTYNPSPMVNVNDDFFYSVVNRIYRNNRTNALASERLIDLQNADIWAKPVLLDRAGARDIFLFAYGSSQVDVIGSILRSLAHPFRSGEFVDNADFHVRSLWWLPPLPVDRIIVTVSTAIPGLVSLLNQNFGGVFRSQWDQEIELVFRDFHDR